MMSETTRWAAPLALTRGLLLGLCVCWSSCTSPEDTERDPSQGQTQTEDTVEAIRLAADQGQRCAWTSSTGWPLKTARSCPDLAVERLGALTVRCRATYADLVSVVDSVFEGALRARLLTGADHGGGSHQPAIQGGGITRRRVGNNTSVALHHMAVGQLGNGTVTRNQIATRACPARVISMSVGGRGLRSTLGRGRT